MNAREHGIAGNMLSGPSLVSSPPFAFQGVTARVFPLRANMDLLTSFCKNYLNVAPKQVCEFYPYLPYVLLVVLDYGRMAARKVNLGWVAQHEIFFAMPLGKWRRDRRGRRIFDGWVLNVPFMVVDNPYSLAGGREIYGWPKFLAVAQYNPEPWLADPCNPIRFLTLDLKGLNCDAPDTRLLEIDQSLGQNPPLAPPDFEMLDPFERLSRLSRSSWSIGFDLAELFLRSPLSGFSPRYPGSRAQVLFDSLRHLAGFYERPGVDVVNLKQFRDAAEPTQICYQALVQSRLSVTRYNSSGLLGLYNLLQGDITGGFFIRFFESPTFPIIESFGLDVARQEWTPEGRVASILEPFFPFWLSVDLTYGRGRNICWRTRGGSWYRQKKNRVIYFPSKTTRTPYNTFAGAAEQEWYGPFLVPAASFDVFPLRADREQLRRLINDYLELEDISVDNGRPFGFKPLGEHVYMVASWTQMFSKTRSLESIEACQISFYVPLCGRNHEGEYQIVMAAPFVFVNNPVLAMTMREVQGIPATDASIETHSRFLRHKGPLLTMQTDVSTTLDVGTQLRQRALLEIVNWSPSPPAVDFQPPVSFNVLDWDRGPLIVNQLTLKWIGDAEDPRRACYRALILQPWSFNKPTRITALEPGLAIRIYRYAGFPLVDQLGLRITALQTPPEVGALADVLTPEDPFRIETSIEIGLGEVLSHTAGFLPWMPPETLTAESQLPGVRIEELLGNLDLERSGLQQLIQAILARSGSSREEEGGAKGGEGSRGDRSIV